MYSYGSTAGNELNLSPMVSEMYALKGTMFEFMLIDTTHHEDI